MYICAIYNYQIKKQSFKNKKPVRPCLRHSVLSRLATKPRSVARYTAKNQFLKKKKFLNLRKYFLKMRKLFLKKTYFLNLRKCFLKMRKSFLKKNFFLNLRKLFS